MKIIQDPARRQWGVAYLEQARADLRAAKYLGSEAPSVSCMLLQMVFEKLGKTFRCVSEQGFAYRRLESSHKGARAMVFYLSTSSKVQGFVVSRTLQLGAKEHLRLVELLELLHPAHAERRSVDKGQLEYPWRDRQGRVCWPERHLPLVNAFGTRAHPTYRPLRAMKFATELADTLDEWLRQM